MSVIGIPIVRANADGTVTIAGWATSLTCANCGRVTPVREMLRDHDDGSFRCVECPDEGWLRRVYGAAAVADLIALREGHPGCLSLAELVAKYPDPLEVSA